MNLTYYRPDQPAKNSPFQKKAPKKNRRIISKTLNVLILFTVAAVVVYGLIIQPNPKITVNSSVFHSSDQYQNAINAKFSNIKNRNKLTLDEKSIVSGLQNQFPELKYFSVSIPVFGQTPTINLKVAEPSFILKTANASYVIVDSGVAVDDVSRLPKITNVPEVIDQTGFNIKPGARVVSASDVDFINALLAQAKKQNIPIDSITLPQLAQELELRTSDKPYFVKFYLDGDPIMQTGQFLAARNHFDEIHKQPKKYLDVRVSGKIYYK